MINRGFTAIEEGLVHYRFKTGDGDGGALPLFMVHAGPVSSASLVPLLDAMGQSGTGPSRKVYAPDTLGYGDSAPPREDAPNIRYYADSLIRVMDALGLEQVDYYGSHTGANIGCELAIAHPDRVRRLVFEGIGLFDKEMRQDLLQNYAPKKTPEEHGGHLQWAWQFLRDQSLFFPYYKRDQEHRLDGSVFPAEFMHAFVVDVLKALKTYHKGYNAVFAHDPIARLPLIKHDILFMAHDYDAMKVYVDQAASLARSGEGISFGKDEGVSEQARHIERFLM